MGGLPGTFVINGNYNKPMSLQCVSCALQPKQLLPFNWRQKEKDDPSPISRQTDISSVRSYRGNFLPNRPSFGRIYSAISLFFGRIEDIND